MIARYKIEAYVLRFQNPKAVKKRPVPKGIKLKKRVRYSRVKNGLLPRIRTLGK
jgi:hypothetical protein